MESPSVNANYCPNCGSLLGQSVNYCSQCGTQCREVVPSDYSGNTSDNDSTSDEEVDVRAFRRRIQAHLQNGWEIEHDHGDSAVLVDRGIGKLWVHALLFLLSAGVINIIYGWKKHSHDARRKLIQAGEPNYSRQDIDIDSFRGTEDGGSSIRPYLIGSLLLLISVGTITSSLFDPVGLVLGFLMLSGSAWAFPPTRRRLKNRHPVTRFGSVRSTDEETITNPERPCVVCGSPIETGVKRSYQEEYALAGIPLFTTETGENNYCQGCISGEMDHTGNTGVTSMNASGPTGDKGMEESNIDEGTLETESQSGRRG